MTSSESWQPTLAAPVNAFLDAASFEGEVEVTPVLLTAVDGAPSKALLWRRRGVRARVGVHLLHPRTDQSHNYAVPALVNAGFAVLARAGRWPNNDVATVHEVLLLDFAAGVQYLHEIGCERVVLYGNSGGGPLATFYQEQATAVVGERLTDTAAGDPLDLNDVELPAADGLVLNGTHVGEGGVMGKCIDGGVIDESDPLATDISLDIYDARNGFRPPPASSTYDDEFLAQYRHAQLDRARRIDALARSIVERQREAADRQCSVPADATLHDARAAHLGWHMLIYRTMADPAMVDLSIDPDDRVVRSYLGPRPDLDNYAEAGFARVMTPRGWLSTWSPLSSRARTADNLRSIHDPLLLIHFDGDCGMRLGEVATIMEAAASADKELVRVPRTEHYGRHIGPNGEIGGRNLAGVDRAVDWISERFA